MAMVLTKVGATVLAGEVVTAVLGSGGYVCGLFQNDLIPSLNTEIGDIVPADYAGYVPLPLLGWSTPITVGDHAKSIANLLEYLYAGPGTENDVYGYYVFHSTTGLLVWLERDPAPFHFGPGSPPYQILPVYTWISEFTS